MCIKTRASSIRHLKSDTELYPKLRHFVLKLSDTHTAEHHGLAEAQAGVCSPHVCHPWTSRYPRFVLMVANSLLAKQAWRPHPMSFPEDRADGRHYLRGKCFPQTQSPQIMACRLDGVCSLILYSVRKLWMAFIKTMNGLLHFFFLQAVKVKKTNIQWRPRVAHKAWKSLWPDSQREKCVDPCSVPSFGNGYFWTQH